MIQCLHILQGNLERFYHQKQIAFGNRPGAGVCQPRGFALAFQVFQQSEAAGHGVRVWVVVALNHNFFKVQ